MVYTKKFVGLFYNPLSMYLCLWGQGDIMEGEIIEVFLGKMVQEQELMY